MTQRVVITRPLPGDPLGRLAAAGLDDVWVNPQDERLSRKALLEAVHQSAAVIATPADVEINAEFFDAAGTGLRIVSNYSVGVDNVDLEEARRRDVIVGYTPEPVTEPTADMAWMLMLAAARRAREGLELARSGQWKGVRPLDLAGKRVVGKTLFIVGAGRIGYAVARRALGWTMKILYHARSRHPEFEDPPFGAQKVDLETGLAQADYVTIHTPLTDETHHLINAERLELMKPSAVLVNTSRGPVVDEGALAAALGKGTIFAAGLDVYENEPQVHPDLIGLENAFLMPHWGSTTDEDREWMTEIAIANAVAALRGDRPPHVYQ